jgi:hypothetical protein
VEVWWGHSGNLVGPKLRFRMMVCIGKWIGYYIFSVNFKNVQSCLKTLQLGTSVGPSLIEISQNVTNPFTTTCDL